MAKILQFQENFDNYFKNNKNSYSNKSVKIMKDLIEIPLGGSSNSDGWSLGNYLEAIYITFT